MRRRERKPAVGFKAAIPLVIIYAFGVALAERFANTTVEFFTVHTGPAMEFIVEKTEPLIELASHVLDGEE